MREEKEITVKVNNSYEDLHKILINQGFKIKEEFDIYDIYMCPKDIDYYKLNDLDVLNKCVLIRTIKEEKMILYKYKEYDEFENITKQGKVKCDIDNIEEAVTLLNYMGYKKLFDISNHSIIYSDNQIEFALQLVNNNIYIEYEDDSDIKEMIETINKLNIDYDKTNYFVKKAQIALNDIKCDF